MFPLAGQTAGPNGVTFFVGTHGKPWGDKDIKKLDFFQNFKFIFINLFKNNFFSTSNGGSFSLSLINPF